jgi:hypothetical protein
VGWPWTATALPLGVMFVVPWRRREDKVEREETRNKRGINERKKRKKMKEGNREGYFDISFFSSTIKSCCTKYFSN